MDGERDSCMDAKVQHIVVESGLCGGQPHVAGSRVRVVDIVALHEHAGYAPDEIVSAHPGITLADVYAALAWYHDNPERIRDTMESDRELAERVRLQNPSRLIARLGSADES